MKEAAPPPTNGDALRLPPSGLRPSVQHRNIDHKKLQSPPRTARQNVVDARVSCRRNPVRHHRT